MNSLLKLTFLAIIVLTYNTTNAQSTQKWNINGNSVSNGDYIGTTNGEPLILKANGNKGLEIKTNGDVKINSLNIPPNANGLVLTNGNGVLNRLDFPATGKQILLDNGTWGSFPNAPSVYWQEIPPTVLQPNTNIFYTGGFIGIGKQPSTALDVLGDVSVTGTLKLTGKTSLVGGIQFPDVATGKNQAVYIDGQGNLKISATGQVPQPQTSCGLNAYSNVWETTGNFGTNSGTAYGTGIDYIGTCDGSDLVFRTANIEAMRVKNASNNINIGNVSYSSQKVNIAGDIYVEGINGFHAAGDRAYVSLGDPFLTGMTTPNHYISAIKGTGVTIGTYLQPDVFCVYETGKVAIGIDSPGGTPIHTSGNHRLYVKGGILTDDVLVATYGSPLWPDYVFDKNYKLKTLNEINAYILANKHLPDVPSSKEVEEKGFSLPDMDATLLRKIEELTLYVIKQDEEISNMKKEISKLKK